ncbi:MAG TPA: Npt1/Npt2 family nucleotide transporter, partial [Chlamydiales bacterium]|nr:Npt1/Npt2 family nucleotide transporter [Chlamydiales bacterium]
MEFGRLRRWIWPIHRSELKKFLPLFLIYGLICFNYSLLRAAKDALVITAPSSGAEAIPFIKVWAILPMAFLVTYLFTRISNRLGRDRTFYVMIGIFLTFFALFSFVIYPFKDALHPHAFADHMQSILPKGFNGMIAMVRNWTYTAFYVMSELWGTMIMTVLFWGFTNQVTKVNDAKRFYAIFGLGANLFATIGGLASASLSSGWIADQLSGFDD